MRINVTPQQLNCFLRVAENGSFSEAARRLAVSQPALSRTIRLTEEALGTRLFDRDTRNVALTPAGVELRPIAERLLAEFEGAFGELALYIAGRRGRITVAALPSIAAVLLPSAIATLKGLQGDVEVLIRDGLSENVVDAVVEGHAEIGLTVQPLPNGKLHYRPLADEAFGLVCRRDDPLARMRQPPWSVFAERPFVAMAPASSVRAMTNAAFLQTGLVVAPHYECSFLGTAGHLIDRGLGISAMPRLALPLMSVSSLVFRPLRAPVVRRQIGIITRAGRSLPPAARIFLDCIEAAAKDIVAT